MGISTKIDFLVFFDAFEFICDSSFFIKMIFVRSRNFEYHFEIFDKREFVHRVDIIFKSISKYEKFWSFFWKVYDHIVEWSKPRSCSDKYFSFAFFGMFESEVSKCSEIRNLFSSFEIFQVFTSSTIFFQFYIESKTMRSILSYRVRPRKLSPFVFHLKRDILSWLTVKVFCKKTKL